MNKAGVLFCTSRAHFGAPPLIPRGRVDLHSRDRVARDLQSPCFQRFAALAAKRGKRKRMSSSSRQPTSWTEYGASGIGGCMSNVR